MKWKDLKHKASPEKRVALKQEALAELEMMERSGEAGVRTAPDQAQTEVKALRESD